MAGASGSPGLQLPAGSPASMLYAAFSPRASTPADPQTRTQTPTHKPSNSHPVQRLKTEEGSLELQRNGIPGVHQGAPSPYASGPQHWGENGGRQDGTDGAFSGRGYPHSPAQDELLGAEGGAPGVRSLPLAPSDTLACLPPQRRAKVVLQEMAGMARRVLDLAQGTPAHLSYPLSSQTDEG